MPPRGFAEHRLKTPTREEPCYFRDCLRAEARSFCRNTDTVRADRVTISKIPLRSADRNDKRDRVSAPGDTSLRYPDATSSGPITIRSLALIIAPCLCVGCAGTGHVIKEHGDRHRRGR